MTKDEAKLLVRELMTSLEREKQTPFMAWYREVKGTLAEAPLAERLEAAGRVAAIVEQDPTADDPERLGRVMDALCKAGAVRRAPVDPTWNVIDALSSYARRVIGPPQRTIVNTRAQPAADPFVTAEHGLGVWLVLRRLGFYPTAIPPRLAIAGTEAQDLGQLAAAAYRLAVLVLDDLYASSGGLVGEVRDDRAEGNVADPQTAGVGDSATAGARLPLQEVAGAMSRLADLERRLGEAAQAAEHAGNLPMQRAAIALHRTVVHALQELQDVLRRINEQNEGPS